MQVHRSLVQLCRQYRLDILYAFGSRAKEVKAMVAENWVALPEKTSDVDIGIKPAKNVNLSVRRKVELAQALEELFGVPRVDLLVIPDVDPFLAANIIRGERLFADNEYLADEYDLYILRRAGDLAFLQREKLSLILDKS
jgi:predicted nucleotidyltransferase